MSIWLCRCGAAGGCAFATVLGVVLVLGSAACAGFVTRVEVHESYGVDERHSWTDSEPTLLVDGLVSDAATLQLAIRVGRTCHEETSRAVRRTQVTIRETPDNFWAVLLLPGILLAVPGVVCQVVGDLGGAEQVGAAGTAMLATGGAGLLAGVIVEAWAVDSEEELPGTREIVGSRAYACREEPAAGVPVLAVFGTGEMMLGRTDDRGTLEVPLETILPLAALLEWGADGDPPVLTIRAGIAEPQPSLEAGAIDLAPWVNRGEPAAWEEAERANTAEAWRRFLDGFPWSPRRDEARRRLVEAGTGSSVAPGTTGGTGDAPPVEQPP